MSELKRVNDSDEAARLKVADATLMKGLSEAGVVKLPENRADGAFCHLSLTVKKSQWYTVKPN
jgi:hypothetical protein